MAFNNQYKKDIEFLEGMQGRETRLVEELENKKYERTGAIQSGVEEAEKRPHHCLQVLERRLQFHLSLSQVTSDWAQVAPGKV